MTECFPKRPRSALSGGPSGAFLLARFVVRLA